MQNGKVTDYIETAPAPHAEIMTSLCQLIHQSVTDAKEEFKWGQPVFERTRDFCYLKAAKNRVNLGFFQCRS